MSAASSPLNAIPTWPYPRTQPSLPESYHSVHVPKGVSFWRKAPAFAGPGYMVAVGYMDPGNWAAVVPLVYFTCQRGKMGRS